MAKKQETEETINEISLKQRPQTVTNALKAQVIMVSDAIVALVFCRSCLLR